MDRDQTKGLTKWGGKLLMRELEFMPGFERLEQALKQLGTVNKAIGDGDFYIVTGPKNIDLVRRHLDAALGINNYRFWPGPLGMIYRLDFNVLSDDCKDWLAEEETRRSLRRE